MYAIMGSVDPNHSSPFALERTDRKQVAENLLQDIMNENFSRTTLEDLEIILRQELLCVKLRNNKTIGEQREEINRIFPVTIERSWLGKALMEVSRCLSPTLNKEFYAEREAQSRLLVTLISVLHAHGVTHLSSVYYKDLFAHLEALFTELQWSPGSSGDLTVEKFRRVQCSFLLSATQEYAAHFKKAEPLLLEAASRVTHLVSVVSLAAAPAMVVNVVEDELSGFSLIFLRVDLLTFARY